jgi:hypothetical protein
MGPLAHCLGKVSPLPLVGLSRPDANVAGALFGLCLAFPSLHLLRCAFSLAARLSSPRLRSCFARSTAAFHSSRLHLTPCRSW